MQNGCSKLNEQGVLDLRERWKAQGGPGSASTKAALAREYGVNPKVFANVITGRTWAHLPL